MQTLKEVREQFYDDYLINRNNFYLSYEWKNIIDNLKWEDWTIYNKSTAAKIAYEFLDWIDATETENAFWESWYIRWYEVALKELQNEIKTNQWNNWWIVSYIQNLLDN